MEEKLAAYRARKARESNLSLFSRATGSHKTPAHAQTQSQTTASTCQTSIQRRSAESEEPNHNVNDSSERTCSTTNTAINRSSLSDEDANNTETPKEPLISPDSYLGRLVHTSSLFALAIKTILWLALFGLFVCFGFGAIFVILSLFYAIYANLRSKDEKVPGEKSAYSVFNPECERIHGTLTAEQIERGMLYGLGGAMR